MPTIQPFLVLGPVSPDVVTAYWRAVCCVAGYANDLPTLGSLCTLAGGVGVVRLTFPLPLPSAVYLCNFAPSGAMVLINGSTQIQQLIGGIFGAALQVSGAWAGLVNSFFAALYNGIIGPLTTALAAIAPSRLVVVGHSLGGAIGALFVAVPQAWPIVGLWSAGQPRVGNPIFALSVPAPYERWTNAGDPVPIFPPASDPFLDLFLSPLWPLPSSSYMHAGKRWAILSTGEIDIQGEEGAWIEATTNLLQVLTTGQGWIVSHAAQSYACHMRRAIPVPWMTPHAAYPHLDQVDALYSGLLAGSGGVCPDDLHTALLADNAAGPIYAVEGQC
jgi:hypothetical protein